MEKLKCINCNNHASHEFRCKLDNSLTYERKGDSIKDCFVLSDHLKSMDKAINLLNKLKNKIQKEKKDKESEDYYNNIKPGNIPPPFF